jgi:hypothetical protein
MSLFPETIKAQLGGRSVRVSFLVLFDFVTTPVRVWTGAGKITTAGEEWLGLGQLGSISGLEQAVNGEAPETTFVLTGINPEIMTLAREEWVDESRDRLVKVYLQFHNAEDDRPLELFDEPYAIWAGRMQTPRFELQGASTRRITVSAESLFSLRSRPAFSQYTDTDQKARFPGDRGFEFVPGLVNKIVTWPDF